MDEQDILFALRTEAAQAGDLDQVELCDLALDGDMSAFNACMWALEARQTGPESE